ncbi:MAG: hypothetical protein Q9195_008724 [Heterodermia aff. obscurata]
MQNSTAWTSSSPTTSGFQSVTKEPTPSSLIYTTGIILSESNIILRSTKSTLRSGSAGLPSQTEPYHSRAASDNIKPTGAYGTGRTKPYFPTSNSTQVKPAFPSSGGGRDVFRCSGTYTIGPTSYDTVTLTTTATVGTTTIAYGDPLPNAVFVKPLPFCTTLIASNCSSDGCDLGSPANVPFAVPFETVLITKKTTAVAYTPQSVGPIFEASTTPVPAQHIPEPNLHGTITSTTPTKSSQAESSGQSSTPGLDTPGVNIGQLPDVLPNLFQSPESGSAGSGTSSGQGGSTPQSGNSGSSNSAHPEPSQGSGDQGSGDQNGNSGSSHSAHPEPSQGSGGQGSDGSSQSGQTPNSDSSGNSAGNESPGNESGVSEGNINSGSNSSPGSSGTTSQNGELPPAVVINPGITTLNHVPVSIGPGGVVVGSHTVAAGAESTIITANGQIFTIEPSRVVAGGTTLPFSIAPNQPYTSVAIGGVPVTLGPKVAVVASTTYPLGSSPTAIVHGAQTYFLGSSKLVAAQTTVNLPQRNPPFAFVTAGGEIFSVYSSQLEAPGITVLMPTGPQPSQFILKGETFTVNPSQLIVPDKTVSLPRNTITPAPSSITAEGVLLSIGSSGVVIGSRTYPLQNPTSIVYNGHTISLGSNGIGMASTTIAVPSFPTFSTVVEGALTLTVNPSEAIIQGHSYLLTQGATPITTVIEGQTVSIGPDGIAFAGTTAVIPRPTEASPFTTIDGITFSVGATDVVVDGKTYAIGGGSTPQTITIGSEILSFGPGGIGLPETTIALAASIVTAGGLTFSVDPTDVVISGTTYPVGAGARPTTITVGGETVSIGPGGVGLPETTIAPAASIVTAGGLTFSLEPTDVVISGTRYQIGAGSRPTTITVGGETVSIGPGGIGLPDTTILPPSTIAPGSSSIIALSAATSSSPEVSGSAFDDVPGAGTTLRIPIDGICLLLFLGLWTLILLLA